MIFAHYLLFDARIEILKITELKSLFVIFKNVQLWRPLVAERVRDHGSRWATENKGLEATTVSSGLFRSFTAWNINYQNKMEDYKHPVES